MATFANSAEASTISNIASGSVAVVGAGGNTGQVFPNIILDAANNRSDYMVFDLSSLAGQSIGTATLTITQPGFYTSSDASETFTLWNFTGDVNALASYSYPSIQPTGAVAAAMRDDLRSGTSYGSVAISGPSSGDSTLRLEASSRHVRMRCVAIAGSPHRIRPLRTIRSQPIDRMKIVV